MATLSSEDAMSRRASLAARLRNASPVILPSMLLCDFGNLEREVDRLEEAGVEAIHMDVMDGVFVPNMTYGMPIIEAIRRLTKLPIDVHLMIVEPRKYAAAFVDAGADAITFHIEAEPQPKELLTEIQARGVAAGLAINPSTDFASVLPFVSDCDLLLVMSVAAGFGGQQFNPVALERLAAIRKQAPDLLLEVDGGVNLETAKPCKQAGANLLVVGSAIFRRDDYCMAMTQLHQSMQ